MTLEDTDKFMLIDSENKYSLFLESRNLIIPLEQELLHSEYRALDTEQKKAIDKCFENNAFTYLYAPIKKIDAEAVIELLSSSELHKWFKKDIFDTFRYFLVGAPLATIQDPLQKLIYDRVKHTFVTVGFEYSNSLPLSHFLKVIYINKFKDHNGYITDLNKKGYAVHKFNIIEDHPRTEGDEIMDEESYLLKCDLRRCGLPEYPRNRLEDIKLGHWDVDKEHPTFYYRDPVKDYKEEGIIGIDFGTKSTVVVKQEGTNKIDLIRVGSLTLTSNVDKKDYENPTIISCMNLDTFINAYLQKKGRPETSCDDFFVSYNALNDFCHCTSDQFYSFYSDLKQWANSEKKDAVVQDNNKVIYKLDESCSIENKTINPIELYAYYLGMYINNMRNGIYLRYIMSFPVKFSKDTKDLIRNSFEKGIKKSLPESIVSNSEIMEKFSVKYVLSEPAAYAVSALENSNLDPEDENDKYLYGVFDFGGGTTDFDFGVWRGASEEENGKYACDYVLECFGADSDPNLGGENILEMIAYHVFKKNKVMAETNSLVCAQPNGEISFAGGESLINNSKEANRNLIILKEAFRPLWEQRDGWERNFINEKSDENQKESITLQLVNSKGELTPNCNFEVDTKELIELIKSRIKKGVDSFFSCFENIMRYNDKAKFAEQLHIFLAGNSCKSVFVKEIFNDKIKNLEDGYMKIQVDLMREGKISTDGITGDQKPRFVVYAPMSNDNNDNDDVNHKPNGKTGVAFGLVKSRPGAKIWVIKNKENDSEAETKFKFYLGTERRKKFECKLKPEYYEDGELKYFYDKWKKFQGAGAGVARIYYTEDSRAGADTKGADRLSIDRIPFIEISFDADESKNLFIKAVGPRTIGYAVAESEQMISSYQTVVIGNNKK